MANDIGGVWRTIGGRRVFIKDGQSLADAMKASGKFKNSKEVEHELNKDTFSRFSEEYEKDKKKHTIDKNDINALNELADSGKDINDYYGLDDIAKDYIKNRRQEMGRNEFTKKADEIHKKTLDEKTKNLEDGKEIYDVYRQMDAKEMEAFAKQNPESIKKMQDYLKSKKTNNDDYEYNLYKQAKENPDSINPMTEWSTDWENLDKRFKDRYEKDNQKWLTEKDSNWLKNQGHDTELEKKIKNFKPSGDIDNDERRLEDISSNYFYDEVGIYNENIDSTATKWAHDKAVELNDKNKQKKTEMLVPIDPYKPEDEARKILGFDSKKQKDDLMTAEQLKGKDREEQKEINKQYLKEQNKLAQEKNKKDDNQFTMYNSQYDKEVTVKKGADGKWVDSDGNKYMSYLSKQDVKQYFKGNWKESTEKRTASEIISSQMSKTKNAKIEVANALGLKYDDDNGWKSTSQLYKEQKGKDISNIAIDSDKADKYNAFVKKNYNHDDKNFSDRADIDKYAKDNNLDADALYYMTKVASESDRTKLKKKAFELYKKQHPNTKKTIYSFEDDIK